MKERNSSVVTLGVILSVAVFLLVIMSSPGLRPQTVTAAADQAPHQQAYYEARIVALENTVNDLARRVTALERGGYVDAPVYAVPVYSAPTQAIVEPSAPAAIQSTQSTGPGCDPSYPDVCIAPYPPDLDCRDIVVRGFQVLPPDLHNFDGDHDGIGCE